MASIPAGERDSGLSQDQQCMTHLAYGRLLDPENDKVQLDTVQRAASAIGRKLRLELA